MAEIPLSEFLTAYALRCAEKSGVTLSDDDLKVVSGLSHKKEVRNYVSTVEKPAPKPKAKKTSRQKKSVKSSESDENKQSESEE